MNTRSVAHFKGFHALRFFAALLVVFHHAESLRKDHDLTHLKAFSFFNNGTTAVTFFFVLSGFLITYLLEKEYQQRRKIAIGWFYWKRVVRIWPLYFLLLFIGLFLQPTILKIFELPYEMPYTIGETWYYFLLFLPGLVTFYFGNHLLEPLWSIGVEEVFYVLWAPIYRYLRRIIAWIIVAFVLFKCVALFWIDSGKITDVWAFLLRTHQFESMAIGGGTALIFYHYGDRFSKAFMQVLGITALMFSLAVFFTNRYPWPELIHQYVFDWPLVKSIFFAAVLLGLNYLPLMQDRLSAKWLEWGGSISYGIYMLHLVVLTGTIELAKFWKGKLPFVIDELLFYAVTIGLTICCAYVSSKTIEKYFMRFRSRFQPRD